MPMTPEEFNQAKLLSAETSTNKSKTNIVLWLLLLIGILCVFIYIQYKYNMNLITHLSKQDMYHAHDALTQQTTHHNKTNPIHLYVKLRSKIKEH